MSSSIRRSFTKWATIALFGLLIASFALWGIGDIFRSGGHGQTVLQVGAQSMGPNEFARAFSRRYDQVRQRFGGNLDIQTARELGLVDQVVQQIVTRQLFDAHAREMGLVVSDEQIVRRISGQTAFRNSQGQFDRARFEQVLQMSGMTEQDYIEILRTDVNRRHLVNAATGGIKAPRVLASKMFRYRNERRVADYILFEDSVFEVAEPSESELRSYYEENGDSFMAPTYREVTLIELTPDQLLDEVRVGEEALREAYESRKQEYRKAEQRHIKQVLLDDEATAKEAVDLLESGNSIAEVADQLTEYSVIDLGKNTKDQLLPELGEAAFKLEEGAFSAPVETNLGWHVMQVTEVIGPQIKSFEAVKDELREELAKDKAVDSLVSLANSLDDELAAGATLEEAAETLGLETRHIDAVDDQGRGPDGEPIEALPAKTRFLRIAFETAVGQQSLLKETEEGGYFVLRVDGETPSQRRPFDQVRESVREQYIADMRQEKARAAAEQAKQTISAGSKTLEDVADDQSLFVETSDPLNRNENRGAAAPAQAVAGALFGVDVGGLVTGTTENGVVLAQLAEIRNEDPSDNDDRFSQLRNQLGTAVQSDVLAQFVDALRAKHPVRVNQALLDEAISQYQ